MLAKLKQNIKNEYDEKYKTDWEEIIGAPITVALIVLFAYFLFAIL
jgi:hypothetical protein